MFINKLHFLTKKWLEKEGTIAIMGFICTLYSRIYHWWWSSRLWAAIEEEEDYEHDQCMIGVEMGEKNDVAFDVSMHSSVPVRNNYEHSIDLANWNSCARTNETG